MATITASVRDALINIYIGMTQTAPGETALSDMVAKYESGMTQKQIAAGLATSSAAYKDKYPALLLASEFADKLVAWMAPEATQAGKDWAKNWIIGRVNAGVSRSDIIVEASNALAAATNTTDFGAAKTAQANKLEVAKYNAIDKGNDADSASIIASVTSNSTTVTSAKNTIDNPVVVGQTYNLTTGVDSITGTSGDDTINATISTASTFTSLDTINGGAGTDTLSISAVSDYATPAGVTISNIEAVKIAAALKVGTFTADGTGNVDLSTVMSGVTSLTISGAATEVDIKAPSAASVTLSGATGGVEIVGGTTQSVTLAAQGGNLKLSGATGDITVTSSKQLANTIVIDKGAAVSVTAGMAATAATTQGAITIGGTTAATGAVTVTNTVSNAAGADSTGSAITVSGGSTITVNQTASQAILTTAGANNTLTQGKVIVNGGTSTTSATVSQSATAAAANTVLGVTGVTEVNTLTFSALAASETLIINGLTFTAGASGATAAEAAAAFANLESGARQGYSTKGTYSGTWTAGEFTSGAANGAVVVFTGTSAGVRTNLADTGTGTDPTVVETVAGVAAVTAAGRGAIVQGAVEIDDAGTEADTMTTASVTGYATGSFVKSDALTTLTLAKNTASASMAVHNNTATTLGLTLDTLAASSTVNLDAAAAKYTNLNITASGGNSTAAITAIAVTALTVAGDKTVNLTSSSFTALKTVTVSGSAGITLVTGANVTSVSTSGTTGANSITIDGTKATYTGGAGVDTLTLATGTALTKAIDLGAGDDTVVFSAAVTGSTATLSGGDGTDTISMTVANADALDASTQTFYTNFERLLLNDAAGDNDNVADTVTIDLSKLGFTNYVATNGTVLDTTTAASSDTLVLDNLANGGTVVIAAAAATTNTKHTVNIKDAATGTADVLNLVLSSASGLTAGTVTAANVETVNLSTVDTSTTSGNTDSVTLTAAAATKVTVSGASTLTLTMTGSTKVTSIDASAATGAVTVTSLNTTSATTITGGTAGDTLTAATGTTADVLIGGGGDDTLTANAGLSTLTGGAGNDIFVIKTASTNVNSYATITDASKGDYLQFTNVGTVAFKSAKVTLGDTAVFQDYANAAINTTTQGQVAWFQFGGNTYVVQEAQAAGTAFLNGTDFIVKLTGLIDLSTASFDTAAVEVRIG